MIAEFLVNAAWAILGCIIAGWLYFGSIPDMYIRYRLRRIDKRLMRMADKYEGANPELANTLRNVANFNPKKNNPKQISITMKVINNIRLWRTHGKLAIPKWRVTPERITWIAPFEVFVFGSNMDGNHAGGAARFAKEKFSAIEGMGKGIQGRSYAIPTIGHDFTEIDMDYLKLCVEEFIAYAKGRVHVRFYVTPIGCGIAGMHPSQVAPFFKKAITVTNITLPKEFWDELI